MALIVYTEKPADLWRKILKAIDDGTVYAWTPDMIGRLTLVSPVWKHRAYFMPIQQAMAYPQQLVPTEESAIRC